MKIFYGFKIHTSRTGFLLGDRVGPLIGEHDVPLWEVQGMLIFEHHFILPGTASCLGSGGHFRLPIYGGSGESSWSPGCPVG